VEGDDAAVACIALDVVDDILCGDPLGVVACDEIPHDHLIALACEECILCRTNPSVRGPEERAVYIGIGFLYVVAVLVEGVSKAADVVVGVVADLMALVADLAEELWILSDVVADHEEGCLDVVVT